jgi:microsomal dipeptidase-like Zn-dependent dipeptidase
MALFTQHFHFPFHFDEKKKNFSHCLFFIAHINHIKNIAGIDHIGIGAGYDGIN